MSVFLETSIGDFVIDLFCEEAPIACENFIKLNKIKFYNNCIFYDVQKGHIALTGDPSSGKGNSLSTTSIFGLQNPKDKYFKDEINLNRKFARKGLVATANLGPDLNTSTFFITLTDEELPFYYKKHTIFGQIVEGLEFLDKFNQVYVDQKNRPLQNIRIKHSMIIDDSPFSDELNIEKLIPSRSPSPIRDEDGDVIDDDVNLDEIVQNMTEE